MTFGENEGQPTLGSLTQCHALVAKAFEAGVNLYDTADVYALGDSERFLGEALWNRGVPRESYVIATKAFGPMGKGRMTWAPRVGIWPPLRRNSKLKG